MSSVVLSSAPLLRRSLRGGGSPTRLTVYWLAFIASVGCFVLHGMVGDVSETVALVLGVASSVTCGFAWLLSRAVFAPEGRDERWPLLLVALLFACTMVVRFASAEHSGLAYVAHVQNLLGSAMLVLIALEALNGRSRNADDDKLRRVFIGAYLSILAVALAARLPSLSEWETTIQLALSIFAAIGATLAVRSQQRRAQHSRGVSGAAQAHRELGVRLTRLMEETRLYRQPGLKVSDLARRLNEPDYKISQAIVLGLGQANFNQWVNGYRVAEAKARLGAAEGETLSILNLSLDCGFNSLGPFNRAFKADTGMTPTQFRREQARP